MSTVEVYMGSPVEYTSERKAIEHIYQDLSTKGIEAILIANINIDSTQVDLIIAFDNAAVVVEIKGSQRPLLAKQNGAWFILSSSGTWSPTGNYYNQTLTAKFRLKDALKKEFSREIPYPDALLLLADGLASGSSMIASDHKVRIEELSGFSALQFAPNKGALTINEWRSFANKIGAIKQLNGLAALNEKLKGSQDILQRYAENFVKTYADDVVRFVAVDCKIQTENISSDLLNLEAQPQPNFLIVGPSGCGKSLLAKQKSIEISQNGGTVILLEAKYFDRLLSPMINDEARLLGAPSGAVLINAASAMGQEVVVVIDGFNECDAGAQEKLIRNLKVVCDRYFARVLIVTQPGTSFGEKLKLEKIEVLSPSIEIKNAIAISCQTGGDKIKINEKLEPVLQAITSGLEAKMVGEMGIEQLQTASRFSLFDQYIRKKMGDRAKEGTRFLCLVAGQLSTHVSFSITQAEMGRLMERSNIPVSLLTWLKNNNLLLFYKDRISFAHELFLNYFSSENIIRTNGTNIENLISTMIAPVFRKERLWILGAIQDPVTLEQILAEQSDQSLLLQIVNGDAGEYSRRWLLNRCNQVIVGMRAEVENLSFFISKDEYRQVQIDPDTTVEWTAQEFAIIAMLPNLNLQGLFVDEMMELILTTDNRLYAHWQNMIEEAREKKVSLRSGLFSGMYVGHLTTRCGFAAMMNALSSGIISFRSSVREKGFVIPEAYNKVDISNGQLYYFLQLLRFSDQSNQLFEVIKEFLTNKFKYLPYHLKVSLIEIIPYCCQEESERATFHELLKSMLQGSEDLMMNTVLFEAIGSLGGFDDEAMAYKIDVKNNIDRLLANPNTETSKEAFGIYSAQFDHPYDSAFYETINELSYEDSVKFYLMALKGASGMLFVSSLIVMGARKAGDIACPLFMEWLDPEKEDSHSPQEDIKVMLLAHTLLGKYNHPLESKTGTYSTERKNSLAATGEICYWINRTNLTWDIIKQNCKPLWEYLLTTGKSFAVSCMRESVFLLRDLWMERDFPVSPIFHLIDEFPDEIASAARTALKDPGATSSVYDYRTKETSTSDAIYYLELFGNVTDIPLLMTFVNDPETGTRAIDAVRKLRENM